ncbi:MAG: polyprenyl diphosphate synthase [Mobiluncus porci]|uniref:polyprenyl diphosphate synthase n=1 Tax=Mobiluncus porci TaxID=2652278 RepID=UPI0023F0966F|nr:polyprenyl diphosphate synthase [Mobiluncus porci]MDD7540849.1 polyprenyl diphosphate synthase [Mobiluncus porci]MDY5749213.1 polyprenyl diphosphate synthase [Mobiluncus porci]
MNEKSWIREIPAPFALEAPALPAELEVGAVGHVAIIMDGNGRWANARGLDRTSGHEAGEYALMDTVAGAVAAGVRHLSVYAFSTENWKRTPTEVRFLMGYSRRVLRARRDELNEWNVRVRWSGREGRLWKSVLAELREAERLTAENTGTELIMCLNYGGRAELTDATRAVAARVARGELRPEHVTEKTLARELYLPDLPDVDLLIRTSGEQRTSNFLPWQAAYAELVFAPEDWPDYGRVQLWRDLLAFQSRDRRFGGAVNRPAERGSRVI